MVLTMYSFRVLSARSMKTFLANLLTIGDWRTPLAGQYPGGLWIRIAIRSVGHLLIGKRAGAPEGPNSSTAVGWYGWGPEPVMYCNNLRNNMEMPA
jgi:hypothetical protein